MRLESKRIFLVESGGLKYTSRFLSTFIRMFRLGAYEQKACRQKLKKNGFWARRDGTLLVWSIDMLDWKRYNPRNGKDTKNKE